MSEVEAGGDPTIQLYGFTLIRGYMSSPSASVFVEEGMTWRDISDPTDADIQALVRDYNFHPLDLEDFLSPRHLTKIEDHGDHVFVSLVFPEEAGDGMVSREILMFLGADYLVTVRPSNFKALSKLVDSWKSNEKTRREVMKSSAFMAYKLIDKMVDAVFSILDDVQVELDSIEEVVFNETKSNAGVINSARRQIAILGRVCYPLTLYVPDLVKAQKFTKGEDLSIYFSDLRHKVGKASRIIEEMKEMVEIYKDADYITSSNRTNFVLSILTIIFTLTIPATVISSIYGMNVPLPGGAVTGPSGVFGLYTSMIFLFSAMMIPALLMIWYFRRVGWF
jgi:magnesium transporter